VGALSCILLVILSSSLFLYGPLVRYPPVIDSGLITQAVGTALVYDLENPYRTNDASVYKNNPTYWGYKYGPVMILGYWPSIFFPTAGWKMTSLLYIGITVAVLASLVRRADRSAAENTAAILFASTVLLLPERLWYDLFYEGVGDILPGLLFVVVFLLIKRGKWRAAGVITGLCFATKFAVAVPIIVVLIRKATPRIFFQGLVIGILPLFIFLLWDPVALINNVFIFNLVKESDSTSLYSITPPELHYLFPLAQVAAIAYVIRRNFNRSITWQSLIIEATLLLMVLQVTYVEVHNNHLLFLYPALAFILSYYRYASWSRLKRPPALHEMNSQKRQE
jgi:hypothetical protein